jgi:hypothetical protein
MKLSIKLILIFTILIVSFVTVNADLGTFKQNDCVNIVTALNVSNVILTNVNSPSPNSTVLITNKAMTKNGNFFNYTFCNTSILGVYTYGYCDDSTNCYSNSFIINGSGQDVSQQQIILIIIGIVVMLIVVAFFFILSLLIKHPGTKIFLMSISALTLIVLIGLISSNANVYLAEFPGIVGIYNTYYIIFMTLAGVSVLGIIIWLIYYSFTLFNKTRGVLPDFE